jgi:hypothetical protein
MWRSQDFDNVAFHLRRLRGLAPSGNRYAIDEAGRVRALARAVELVVAKAKRTSGRAQG